MRFDRRTGLIGAAALGLMPRLAAGATTARRLSNPRASAAARALHAYLWSIYGRRTMTGQQENPGTPRDETAYIERTTGRLPAILGLDYIDPEDWAQAAERATAWHRAGGIMRSAGTGARPTSAPDTKRRRPISTSAAR